ncbi:protease inhibitor I42 family protein [Mycobacterium sp.]|uniref:protease inhibitor I42 family protein n=1 Tax=Mycobacterium sp. TaxID=1785 RepID=UPI003F9ACC1B
MTAIPTHLVLSVGQHVAVELPRLGVTGYAWAAKITGNDGVVDIEWTRGLAPNSPLPPVGASAPEIATFIGVASGTTTVQLFQHRPWEPPEQSTLADLISVEVRDP